MHRSAWATSFVVLSLLLGRAGAQDKPHLREAFALERAMQSVIKQVEPAIACILVSHSKDYGRLGLGPSATIPGKLGSFIRKEIPFDHDPAKLDLIKRLDMNDPDYIPESYGSGVVVDASGQILTNYHVIRDATKIFVYLPGGKGSYANIHAADSYSDLAILQLIDKVPQLTALPLGKGEDVSKGQFVLSLANPFAAGFRDGSPSVSWGIISNIRRRPLGQPRDENQFKPTLHHHGTLLQTDARINLGCSGGALVNLKGEMVGLVSSIAALSGIDTPGGFAIPMSPGIRRIVDKLKKGEEVEYGFLGIMLGPKQHLQSTNVVRVSGRMRDSPASKAGLETGDYIFAVNDEPIQDADDLIQTINTYLAGNSIRLEVASSLQNPRRRTIQAELIKSYLPNKTIASNRPPSVGGLRIDYASVLLRAGSTQEVPPGVAIREVEHGSPAEKAGLYVDQLITHVNGHMVSKPADYYYEVGRARRSLELTLTRFGSREVKFVRLQIR